MIVVFVTDSENAVVLMPIVKLNQNNLKYLFFMSLWVFIYEILFWVVLDVSFCHAGHHCSDTSTKVSPGRQKEQLSAEKLFCPLFI